MRLIIFISMYLAAGNALIFLRSQNDKVNIPIFSASSSCEDDGPCEDDWTKEVPEKDKMKKDMVGPYKFMEKTNRGAFRDDAIQHIGKAPTSTAHRVVFAMKQLNLDFMESLLHEVSDPESVSYANHLNREEIGEITTFQKAILETKAFLGHNHVKIVKETKYSEFITAEAPIAVWEKMFATEFYAYDMKVESSQQVLRLHRAERYFLPFELVEYVENVFYTVQFPPPVRQILSGEAPHFPNNLATEANGNPDEIVSNRYFPYTSPELVKSFYHMPAAVASKAAAEQQSEGTDVARQGLYTSLFAAPQPTVDGDDDTDAADDDDFDTGRRFFPQQLKVPAADQVNSAVQTTNNHRGRRLDAAGYVNLQDCPVRSQKSLSSEDDDDDDYDYSINAVDSDCEDLAYTSPVLQYMLALSSQPTLPTYYAHSDEADWLVSWLTQLLDEQTLISEVIGVAEGSPESYYPASYVLHFNREVMKLGAMGVSVLVASGDDGVGNSLARQSTGQCGYVSDFPSISPYVTSIGGSMGPEHNLDSEKACSTADPSSMITSGGGFATSIPMPSYQQHAVQAYFQEIEASQHTLKPGYEAVGRAYPDLALLSNNYLFLQGADGLVNGSSTVFGMAAMVSMVAQVNAQRVKRLGWLNPLLYHPTLGGAFTQDIREGDNHCTGYYYGDEAVASGGKAALERRCCEEGFVAAKGWDPVTGLGSVNFTSFLNTMLAYDEKHREPQLQPRVPPSTAATAATTSTIASLISPRAFRVTLVPSEMATHGWLAHSLDVLGGLLLGKYVLSSESSIHTDSQLISSSSVRSDCYFPIYHAQILVLVVFVLVVLLTAGLLLGCLVVNSSKDHQSAESDSHSYVIQLV